ncbi:unnamed protein product [Lactuca saligna]|uniref:NAC domain-containing protein n=1 Tax=Lactuca saligna TaxID=75948 RepID=A0AA35ZIE0_LACSI|nr:unnamed protein product [Lactuca saligna]
MDVEQEIIPYSCNGGKQVTLDFADQLPSGYRFCPTDSELIVDYLNAKIESREPPKCRLHEVNIYNHRPEELAEHYRSHENKWYFLTSRDRKYPKGNRPDRAVLGKLGTWKTTQKHKPVYDATSRQMVGHKGSLAYFENDIKTMWLMHEYTINGPNLPFENGDKLNEWVLCKIYKKLQSRKRRRGADQEDPKEAMEEPNISLPKRRRVSKNNEINFSNDHHPEQVDVQETNRYSDTCRVQMVANVHEFDMRGQLTPPPMGSTGQTWVNNGDIRMNSIPYPIPMQQQPVTSTVQGRSCLIQAPPPCYQNQFTSNAINGCQSSYSAASGSVSIEPPASSAQPQDDNGAYTRNTTDHGLNSIQPVQNKQTCYDQTNTVSSSTASKGFVFSNGVSNSSSMEPLIDYSSGQVPVLVQISNEDAPTLLDMQNASDQGDAVDSFHFPDDGYEATITAHDEGGWSLESLERFLNQPKVVPQGDAAEDFHFPDGYEAMKSAPVDGDWSLEGLQRYLNQSMVVPQVDAAEDFHFPDGYEAMKSAPLEGEWSLESLQRYLNQSMVVPQVDAAEDFHFPDSYKAATSAPVELEWDLEILESHLNNVNTTPLEINS